MEDVILDMQIAAGLRPGNPEIVLLVPTDTDKLTLAWLPVTDNAASSEEMVYEVHLSRQENFQPSPDTLKATVTSETQKDLTGLETGTTYYASVIAVDRDGNRSAKQNYHPVTTFTLPIIESSTTTFDVDENLGLVGATKDGTDYSYANTADTTPPEVGSILFTKVGEDVYLRKVDSLNTTDENVVVQTGDAELTQVLEQAAVSTELKLFDVSEAAEWSNQRSDIATKRSVRSDGSRHSVVRWKNDLLVAEQVDHAGEADNVRVSPDLRNGRHVIRIARDTEESVEVSAGVTFTPKLETDLEWKVGLSEGVRITRGEVIASGKLSIDLETLYKFSASGSVEKEIPFPLLTRTYRTLYSIGTVPVYQTVTFTLKAVLSASASTKIEAKAHANASATLELGTCYDPDTKAWGPVSPSLEFDKSIKMEMNVQGGVKGEVRLIPEIKVEFYRVIAASLTIEPFLSGEIQAEMLAEADIFSDFGYLHSQLTQCDFSLAAESFIGVSFGMFSKKIPILEKTEIWKSPTWQLFSLPHIDVDIKDGPKGSIDLIADVEDGANNPFDDSSAKWIVYPENKGRLVDNGRTASFYPTEVADCMFFFSGHGILGEIGRRFITDSDDGNTGEGNCERDTECYAGLREVCDFLPQKNARSEACYNSATGKIESYDYFDYDVEIVTNYTWSFGFDQPDMEAVNIFDGFTWTTSQGTYCAPSDNGTLILTQTESNGEVTYYGFEDARLCPIENPEISFQVDPETFLGK